MLALFATWMFGLIFGFAWLHRALGTVLHSPEARTDFLTYLYLSGVTFSTLGFGDVVAVAPLGRLLTVVEASLGFGFLACVIGYLPAIFQAFVASRSDDLTPGPLEQDRRRVQPNYCCAPLAPAIRWRSSLSWRSGNAGRRSCWKAISHFPF